jgi:hypothetical protein
MPSTSVTRESHSRVCKCLNAVLAACYDAPRAPTATVVELIPVGLTCVDCTIIELITFQLVRVCNPFAALSTGLIKGVTETIRRT